MSDLVAAALSGSSRLYVPYAWEELPAIVNLRSEGRWWADPVTSRRLALDLMGSTRAGGIAVSVLHPRDWAELGADEREELAFDPLADAAVSDTLASIRSLTGSMPAPVVGVLPDLLVLESELDGDSAGDLLCDLARGAFEAGVSALVVLGAREDHDVVGRITRLADNFGAPVVVLSPNGRSAERGVVADWTVRRADADGVVSLDTTAQAGLILTPGDVSTVWSREQVARHGAGQ